MNSDDAAATVSKCHAYSAHISLQAVGVRAAATYVIQCNRTKHTHARTHARTHAPVLPNIELAKTAGKSRLILRGDPLEEVDVVVSVEATHVVK